MPLRIVLLAVAGALLALAMLVWSAWRDSNRLVVIDMPAATAPDPAQTASGDEDGDAVRGGGSDTADERDETEEAVGAAEAGAAEAVVEPAEGESEAVLDVGGPAFFETPMQVVRRSNIRAQPTPDSTALGRAEEGTMVILVDPQPTRGYYRIATGELEGWIWGANLVAADLSQQPDAEADPEEASPPADERPAEAAPQP
jgi:Bacterial SH3 domain